MKRLRLTPTALGLLAVALLLIGGASRAMATPRPVSVIQAQIVERMFDESGAEVLPQSGWQFVMVELSEWVRPDQVRLNGRAPVARVNNQFVFEVEVMAIGEMTFAYRPDTGRVTW